MSHTFRSKDHTNHKSGDEISYSFVHDAGLTSGGAVTILAFNESKLVEEGNHGMKFAEKIGEITIHKDALVSFVASMVRNAKEAQLGDMNEMGVFGL
jgi:hypothetical protein